MHAFAMRELSMETARKEKIGTEIKEGKRGT